MTIFALEQAVSNGCQLGITEAESALEEVAALRTENERLRACFDWANGAAEEGWLPAQEVRKLRAQLAEAQKVQGQLLDALTSVMLCEFNSMSSRAEMVRIARAAIDAAKGEPS